MRTVIRRTTFETNSSSVHTLILIPYDVAEQWKELGDEYWMDMNQIEAEAESSGSGYGECDGVAAPARIEHLVSKDALRALGEWKEPKGLYDDIDMNWMIPLDVIENPERHNNDIYSSVGLVRETDDGWLIYFD